MAVELDDILNDVKWIDVPLGNRSFAIAYRPSGTSIQRQSELRRMMARLAKEGESTEIDESEEMGKILVETVADWDLVRKGEKVPLRLDVVKALPQSIYDAVMAAITEDRKSGEAEKKSSSGNSGAPSQAITKPGSSLNGTPSSEQRGSWA